MIRKLMIMATLAVAAVFGGGVATASAACTAQLGTAPTFNNNYDGVATPTPYDYVVQVPMANVIGTCSTVDNHRYIIDTWMESHYPTGWISYNSNPNTFDSMWAVVYDDPPNAGFYWDSPNCNTPHNDCWSWLNNTANTNYRMQCVQFGKPSPWTEALVPVAGGGYCSGAGYPYVSTDKLFVRCNNLDVSVDSVRLVTKTIDMSTGTTSIARTGGIVGGLPGGCHS